MNDIYQTTFGYMNYFMSTKLLLKIKVRLNILIQGCEFSVFRLNSVFLNPFGPTFSIVNQNVFQYNSKSFKDIFMK